VAFVFLGSASGIANGNPATAAARLESDQNNAGFGFAVAAAGDVNGDGFPDLIVGAPNYDNPQTDEGAAFVFYGNGNRSGRLALPRQRGISGGLVQPWGSSYTSDYQVKLIATDAAGRGRVKLQVQSCPAGVPFGHASCTTSTAPSWFDVTTSPGGISLAQSVTGVPDDTLRRWRVRVLRAPYSVTKPGVTVPPNPAHGPWRRLFGQVQEADLRVRLDTDHDGLPNSVDPDDDNDGLSDVAELALGTNPLDPDTDHDTVLDGTDNCPFVVNASQTNSDSFAAGDACQCGDVTGDGSITAADYQRAQEYVVGRTLSGPFVPQRCDVTGDGACDVADLAVLDRIRHGASATLVNRCAAWGGP
jgi:hypothetical protein